VGFTPGRFAFLLGESKTRQRSLEMKRLLKDHQLPERQDTIRALSRVRKEWEEIAGAKSLTAIESPVGLLLSDIADQLQLTPGERMTLLGGKLTREVEELLKERVSSRSQA
jgi:hypothetical protein